MAPVAEQHEHRASPRLGRLVERAVGYRLAGHAPGVHVGMPSGSVTLVIPLEQALILSDSVIGAPQPFDSVVAGLATSPTRIHHDGVQHGVQLALRTGAVRALFGCPAAELAETSYELEDVMGRSAVVLRDRLHEIPSWEGRFAVVEQVLLDLERDEVPRRLPAPEVLEAWRLIGVSGGSVPIRDVAARVGWSMRRLQHQFRAEFGVTPKGAAVVRRFERSVPLVAAGAVPLTDVAVGCGWSDHAHMDRDWRALAGTAPTRWLADDALAAR